MEVIEVARRLKSNYVVNLRNGMLHKVPTTERCNVDQVQKKGYYKAFASLPTWQELCEWCFRQKEGVPGPSDSRKPCP